MSMTSNEQEAKPQERPIVERECANVHCKKKFTTDRPNVIYCSEGCFCEGEGFEYVGTGPQDNDYGY